MVYHYYHQMSIVEFLCKVVVAVAYFEIMAKNMPSNLSKRGHEKGVVYFYLCQGAIVLSGFCPMGFLEAQFIIVDNGPGQLWRHL